MTPKKSEEKIDKQAEVSKLLETLQEKYGEGSIMTLGETKKVVWYYEMPYEEYLLTNGLMGVTLIDDVNGDGKVDLLDVSHMSDAWGVTVKDDAWLNLNPESDNIVDLLDLSLLAGSFEG